MPLYILIALALLIIAGVWVLAELALTFRESRKTLNSVNEVVNTANHTIDDVRKQLNDVIDEVKPVVGELKTTMENIQPALNEVPTLLNKVGNAVDAVSLDLLRVDEILSDVSTITETAAGATSSLSSVSTNASQAANGLLNKVKSRFGISNSASADHLVQGDMHVAEELGEPMVEMGEDITLDEHGVIQEKPAVSDEYISLQPPVASSDEGYFTFDETKA